MSKSKLQTSIEYLKSVGPSRAEILTKELNISTWSDLLYHFPFRYVDKTIIGSIADAIASGEPSQFVAKVTNISLTKGRFKKRLNVTLFDGKTTLKAVWFQGAKWVVEKLSLGSQYLFYGTVKKTKSGLSFAHHVCYRVFSGCYDVFGCRFYLRLVDRDFVVADCCSSRLKY